MHATLVERILLTAVTLALTLVIGTMAGQFIQGSFAKVSQALAIVPVGR